MLNSFLFSVAEHPSELVSKAYRCVVENAGASARSWDSRQAALAVEDLGHHVRFVSSAAAMNDENLLVDYIAWVQVLCNTLGFRPQGMALSMRCLQKASLPVAGESAGADLAPWFAKAADLLERPLDESNNPYLKPELQGNPAANLFLNALLEGRRDFALSIVHSEKSQGYGLARMYDRIFVPSQRELGRLWHLGKISVAQEHFVTAATQVIISGLYEDFFRTDSYQGTAGIPGLTKKPRMIAACAQGELHEMGIRMIADTFSSRGWDTIFLGGNLPEWELMKEIRRSRPDIVSLSATIFPHVSWVERAIAEMRQLDQPPGILVGGKPFLVSSDLWRKVGADATAADCESAIAAAESLRASA